MQPREVTISIWTDLIRLARRRGARPSPAVVDAPGLVSGADAHASRAPARSRAIAPAHARIRASVQDQAVERVVERAARPPHAATAGVLPANAADGIARWQARVLDLLSDGVLLVDGEGRVTYRNAAAAALMHDDGAPLLREARALALLALTRGTQPAAADAACELATDAVQYRLSAVLAPAALLGPGVVPGDGGPLVLVAIARGPSAFPSPATLRRRFQLTAREASVALLLAAGRSNGSIARRLGISASTTRHYTEAVLLKLAVPSRAAVAAVLLGVYEHTDEHPLPDADVLSARR